jgi:hypothetical protein
MQNIRWENIIKKNDIVFNGALMTHQWVLSCWVIYFAHVAITPFIGLSHKMLLLMIYVYGYFCEHGRLNGLSDIQR